MIELRSELNPSNRPVTVREAPDSTAIWVIAPFFTVYETTSPLRRSDSVAG